MARNETTDSILKIAFVVLAIVIIYIIILRHFKFIDWLKGYHSEDNDETGQCHPDTEAYYPGHPSRPDTTNCSNEELVCKKYDMTGCMINGRMIGTFPDEECLRSPAQDKCATDGLTNCDNPTHLEYKYCPAAANSN